MVLRRRLFFRELVRGYLKGDERIQSFIDEIKQQSIKHKTKSKRLRTTGKENLKSLTLKDSEIENIFDLLEEEYPEL